MKKIELLAPAGGFQVMKAVIEAGADAVYMGLPKFSARSFAENADGGSFVEAIHYAHLRGRKLYLTLNTLLKERELEEELDATLKPLYEAGLDAVIVQDLGVMKRIAERFPLLPIHVSTQATVVGPRTAEFLKRYHATRIVPARELSLPEIRELANTGLEIECFVHGALCYCYSGHCLFSSLVAGRSGNRGRCAQPCRLPYLLEDAAGKPISGKNETYLLSMKDLNTLSILPKILDAGVLSLKIEGRMKKAEYAAGVTSIYRRAIDRYLADPGKPYVVPAEDEKHLFDLFNRQGFTKGYYEKRNGRDMIALSEKEFRKEDEDFLKEIRENYLGEPKKIPVTGVYRVKAGEPLSLKVSAVIGGERFSLSFSGEQESAPLSAKTNALTRESLEKQLLKTGATEFAFESLSGELDDGLFLPVKALNEFRRSALDLFRETVIRYWRRV